VESSVVRMLPRPEPLARDDLTLQALLSAGFGQRRKMIRNTLGRWLAARHPGFDLAAAAERDPRLLPFTESTRRAEEIAVASWCALADALAPPAGA
jgi:16S rRNA (adenine1518-N6/adenine1519-N6)-dimethyltransferase